MTSANWLSIIIIIKLQWSWTDFRDSGPWGFHLDIGKWLSSLHHSPTAQSSTGVFHRGHGEFVDDIQSNLDYPDFSIIRTFSLVPIWSWIFINHDQLRSVAISFLKLLHWKVQSNARVFCSQRAKSGLARFVTKEEHSKWVLIDSELHCC